MKDVETFRPAEIALAAILPRADTRDRLIGASSIEAIPGHAALGTSSPRRAAQMLNLRPDLNIKPLRGNVATRLASIGDGAVDVTLLAAAGLERLGRDAIGVALEPETLLPAAQQGAIGIEILAGREDLRDAFRAVDDEVSHRCIAAERALLEALGADCRSPVAALAQPCEAGIDLRAQLLSTDGRTTASGRIECPPEAAEQAARDLCGALLTRADSDIRKLFAA